MPPPGLLCTDARYFDEFNFFNCLFTISHQSVSRTLHTATMLTALIHHIKKAGQFTTLAELLIGLFTSLSKSPNNTSPEHIKSLRQTLEIISVATTVRQGSRLTRKSSSSENIISSSLITRPSESQCTVRRRQIEFYAFSCLFLAISYCSVFCSGSCALLSVYCLCLVIYLATVYCRQEHSAYSDSTTIARKNRAAKMVAPRTPAPPSVNFDITMLNFEHAPAKLSSTTRIWYIQEYESKIYQEIM